jgi:hypothetical protein
MGVCAHVIPSKLDHRADSRLDAAKTVQTAKVMGEVDHTQKLLVKTTEVHRREQEHEGKGAT